jgi:hypothetical protein
MLEFDLQAGKLGLTPGNAQIFYHQSYFSKDRDNAIVFAIVIEFVVPTPRNPGLSGFASAKTRPVLWLSMKSRSSPRSCSR